MKTPVAALWFVCVLLMALAVGVYLHEQPNTLAELTRSLPFFEPCAKPLPYTVGTIDSKFGLTKDQVAAKLAAAAKIWNDAAGKEVLAYEPDAKNAIPVNFIYDSRQQAVTVGQHIDSTEASQLSERASLEADQQKYIAAQQQYASDVEAFNSDSQAYAEEVSRVNSSGGADQATYNRLNAEKATLKNRQDQLSSEAAALNQQAQALKARIASFNASVKDINGVVQDFNATVGGDFEEGQYTQDGNSRRIDIYAYKSQSELLHTVTHEFGHALGLDHNSNPVSIMYPYNKEGITLSADDIAALKAACKLK